MVQVIGQGRVRPKSTSQQFGEAFSRLAQGASEHFNERQMMKEMQEVHQNRMNQENEAFKREFGGDISGVTDPKTRQEIFKQAMQVKQAPQMYNAKYGAKLGALEESGLGNYLRGSSQENKNEEKSGFNPANIPDEQIAAISAIDPNIARSLMHSKDVAMREQRSEREFEERKRLSSPEYQREKQVSSEQAKADIKYNNDLQAAFKQHEIKKNTLEKLEKLNKKGVTGKPYEKLLEKFGLVNLTSEGRREFAADVKNLITDIRSILGAQFTGFEFQTILNAYPNADFSKDANAAIINNLKEFEDIRDQEFKIANRLVKENNGKIPENLQSKVNENLQEYAKTRLPYIKENTRRVMNEEYGIKPGHTLLFDPNGEPLNVPDSDVAQLLEMGAFFP